MLTRRFGVVAAALVILVLAACDTQPATDVTESAATLNAKGACTAGVAGTWEYQLRPVNSNVGWQRVGPPHDFSCGQNTGEVALTAERAKYLAPGTLYAFRVVSRLNNGTVQAWDANGTNGGTAYDTFTTGTVIETAESPPAYEPTDPDDDPVASAAGCRRKEIKNPRVGWSWPSHIKLWTLTLRTRWRYCNGQVTRMWPAVPECDITSAGVAAGYKCEESQKIRAISLGGDPEHVVWTHAWQVVGRDPIFHVPFYSKRWCASTYASGSNKPDNHYRNGRCDLVPWGT